MSVQFPGGKNLRIKSFGPRLKTFLAKSDSRAEFSKRSSSFFRSGSVAKALSGSWTFSLRPKMQRELSNYRRLILCHNINHIIRIIVMLIWIDIIILSILVINFFKGFGTLLVEPPLEEKPKPRPVTHGAMSHPKTSKSFPRTTPPRLQQQLCDCASILNRTSFTNKCACKICLQIFNILMQAKSPYFRLSSPLKFCGVLTNLQDPTPSSLQKASRQTWQPGGRF